MPDYQESSVAGSKYRRWSRINIEYPRVGTPTAIILEDEIVVLDQNDVIERPVGNLSISLSDPAKEIPLRDPTNGWELTGATATMGYLYALIGSVCWQAALERDAQQPS